MDLNNLAHSPNFDEFLNNPEFPPHFDQLELDSLLYGNDESQESTSSASFGFSDSHAGFRSRGDGSLGDSSSDSSPPLSCANFTENDQEMWDFGFQNPCPFENLEQQLGPVYHEEEVITQPNNDFLEAQFLDNAPLPVKQMPTGPKRIIAILPKQQQQSIRRVVNRPIHKVYRVREVPVNQQQQTYRISQSINLSPPHGSQDHVNQMYYSEQVPEFHMQSRSRPITRQASEDKRFVPIAPTVDIKTEPQIFSSEQNRKIRNRMYAQASRIRKKEAEENLKQNLQELLHENEILKAENASLKQRLSYYEHVDHDIRISQPMERSQKQKKIIAAGTVLMMFGIVAIISPFNINSSMNMNTHVIAISNETSLTAHRSRVLVSENTVPVVKKPQHDSYDYLNSTQNDCDLYKMNATETIRVNNDIERWVQVHSFDNVPLKFSGGLLNKEVMRKFNEERKMRASSVYGPKTLSALKKSEQAALRMRERTWRQLDLLKAGNNIQVDNDNAQRKRQNIEKIASIVRQNGDTLYIMTLQDYVFLPSLQKGPKSIPKLSLLLPSVPMNGTLLDQYTLLRVDCEVTGTGQLTLSNKQLSYLLP